MKWLDDEKLTRELEKLGTNGYQTNPKKHEIITESLMAGLPFSGNALPRRK